MNGTGISREEAINQAMNNISNYIGKEIIYVTPLWLETLCPDNKDIIGDVMSKYPKGSTVYEVAKLAIEADDIDTIVILAMLYDGYLPLRWDILARYIRSTSMYKVLYDKIQDPDIRDRLDRRYGDDTSIMTCHPPINKEDAINSDRIGCLTIEDIHDYLFSNMSTEPVPDIDAVALPDNVIRYQNEDMTLVTQVLDAAIRAGSIDVIDYIVGEYGFQHAPVLRIGVPPDPMKVLEEASHDALMWLIDREYYEPDDLVNAIIYDEAEMIQDDVLDTDAIVATLKYGKIDIYNNYWYQIDQYVLDNPDVIGNTKTNLQAILLSNPDIVERFIDVIGPDIELTIEMVDIMMQTLHHDSISDTRLWDIVFDRGMIEIVDKYITMEMLGNTHYPFVKEYRYVLANNRNGNCM